MTAAPGLLDVASLWVLGLVGMLLLFRSSGALHDGSSVWI